VCLDRRRATVGTGLAESQGVYREEGTKMIVDLSTELAPVLWVSIGLLVACASAIAADIDYRSTELQISDRQLLIATAAVIVVVLFVLIAAHYDAAANAAVLAS
jgi:hypothetical protein